MYEKLLLSNYWLDLYIYSIVKLFYKILYHMDLKVLLKFLTFLRWVPFYHLKG
jgi:hypothetical protein